MTRRVLITGATGFTGSFLVESYTADGWEVHGTSHGHVEDLSWLPDEVTIHETDLREVNGTRRLVAEVHPDVVAHLSALSSVSASLQKPLQTYIENVGMQMNVLDAVAADAPGARVLVVGSGDEYGNVRPDENPVSERQELRPINPYALSKVAQDLMGFQYVVARGLDIVRARPFIQVGPRRSDQFAGGHFARQMAEIEVNGAEPVIEVGNVDLQRDITDVRDVVHAYRALIHHGRTGEVYNLGTGTASSWRTFLTFMLQEARIDAEIREVRSLLRPGEPPLLVGDVKKVREATGWCASIPLQQTAIDTLNYWRERVARGARSTG
jgi:GDP-4-dehydro-6-deoxy-D-mannose reductase